MRARPVQETGAVEQPDRDDRHRQQTDQPPRLRPPKSGQDRAHHQEQPKQEADEQRELPDAPQLDVLVALVSQPEACVQAELLVDRQEFTGQRSNHHDEERTEQDVDAKALVGRFLAPDDGRKEQARAEEGGRDPEDRRLDVPRASQ